MDPVQWLAAHDPYWKKKILLLCTAIMFFAQKFLLHSLLVARAPEQSHKNRPS